MADQFAEAVTAAVMADGDVVHRWTSDLSPDRIRRMLEAAAPAISRDTAARFYHDVRELIRAYADHERDVIAWMPFSASLDQLAREVYGLADQGGGDG